MSILNATFYPSPPALVRALIAPYEFENAYVLDPSAGDGRILLAIREQQEARHFHSRATAHLYACELEPDLRAVIAEHDIPLVGQDFLMYREPTIRFTHILMNPPFNHGEGVRHLLHAWEILRSGEIACVLPASALGGDTLFKQTLANLIQDYGRKDGNGPIELLGQIYRGAERPTDEEIWIVRLTKPDPDGDFAFAAESDPELRPRAFEDAPSFEMAVPGFVPNLLAHFAAARKEFQAYAQHRVKMERYAGIFEDALKAADTGETLSTRYNNLVTKMQEQGWAQILDHPAFQGIMTERARQMFHKFRQRQQGVDFTETNIRLFFQELQNRSGEILNSVITDAFDQMTKWHAKNREGEGWITNSSWKIGKRVIVPWGVDARHMSFWLNQREEYNDIDRALCVVSGRPFDEIVTIARAVNDARYDKRSGVVLYSTFFKIRLFLKGTVHLEFLNLDLLEQFNIRAAQAKGWLPDDTAPSWEKVKQDKVRRSRPRGDESRDTEQMHLE